MNIFFNQKEISIVDESTILDLVTLQKLPISGIAFAIDNQIVKRELWESTTLTEGDRVTIIIATFGG